MEMVNEHVTNSGNGEAGTSTRTAPEPEVKLEYLFPAELKASMPTMPQEEDQTKDPVFTEKEKELRQTVEGLRADRLVAEAKARSVYAVALAEAEKQLAEAASNQTLAEETFKAEKKRHLAVLEQAVHDAHETFEAQKEETTNHLDVFHALQKEIAEALKVYDAAMHAASQALSDARNAYQKAEDAKKASVRAAQVQRYVENAEAGMAFWKAAEAAAAPLMQPEEVKPPKPKKTL